MCQVPYKLVEGDHLNDKDLHKVLIHKDLAKKNNLKIGDKLKLKSCLLYTSILNEQGKLMDCGEGCLLYTSSMSLLARQVAWSPL